MPAPPPSPSREAALDLAGRLRTERSTIIDEIRSGVRSSSDVIASQDPAVGRIKVVAVLENIPDLGKVAARRMMDDLGIEGHFKIRDLSSDQCAALLDRLDR